MFEPKQLRLVPEAPTKYQDDTKYQTPDFFNNFFVKSGYTLSPYPDDLRADTVLVQYFNDQAQKPTQKFVQMINHTANFYKDAVNLTQFLGSSSGKHYHFLLGSAHSKKLRYSIASSQETRDSMLQYGKQSLPYLATDFPEFASTIDQVHLISLHIGVLRSELMEVSQFQDLSNDDPLVRLFAVGKHLAEEKDVIERERKQEEQKMQSKQTKVEAIKSRREALQTEAENKIYNQRNSVTFALLIKAYTDILQKKEILRQRKEQLTLAINKSKLLSKQTKLLETLKIAQTNTQKYLTLSHTIISCKQANLNKKQIEISQQETVENQQTKPANPVKTNAEKQKEKKQKDAEDKANKQKLEDQRKKQLEQEKLKKVDQKKIEEEAAIKAKEFKEKNIADAKKKLEADNKKKLQNKFRSSQSKSKGKGK